MPLLKFGNRTKTVYLENQNVVRLGPIECAVVEI